MAVTTPQLQDVTVQLNGFKELLNFYTGGSTEAAYHAMSQVNSYLNQHPYSSLSMDEAQQEALAQIMRNNGYTVNYDGNGKWTSTAFQQMVESTETSAVNSNIGTTFRGNVRQYLGMKQEQVGDWYQRNLVQYPKSGGLGQQATYLIGSVAGAVGAVSTGIALGKAIDSTLYNLNPDFWNSIGLESINPQTWGSLTNGDDSPFAGLLNMILGIDPTTGTGQMYIDQNALAYIAYAMAQAGIFEKSEGYTPPSDTHTRFPSLPDNATFYASSTASRIYYDGRPSIDSVVISSSDDVYFGFGTSVSPQPSGAVLIGCSKEPFTYTNTNNPGSTLYSSKYEYNGVTLYYTRHPLLDYGTDPTIGFFSPPLSYLGPTAGYSNDPLAAWAYVVLYGSTAGGVDGITDQTGATLPDTSTWDTPENTLASLQQQYPNMFNNAMVWDDDFGDTVGNTRTYIPVPMPYIDGNYNQPVSINPDNAQQQQTQPDTSIDPTITPEVLTQIIAEIVQQTKTQTQPDTEVPPANPTDTGTGEPTPLVPPVGTASALWSVYHPTQAQINQFGAWLWTDSIIEQFLRLMNNPMEGIISLHRVFVTPVDSGTGTIVVGRLDSNVPTATVTQQYVYVDCGTVNLNEQFANVFDYAPYTNVSLYLPFVGIVGLNVSDIMRSSINVNYGVDVFTGACLAMVRVTRDGNTVNLYQYTGVASVQYPLTGAQNSGLLNGLFGIASGIGSIAMGNIAGGTAMVAGGAVNALHTNMSRSGGFSGNAGAMGIKTPYLIIERPQTQVANTFPNQQGYPTNHSATLGEYTGFVQCRALHTDGIAATHDELAEIRRYLETGVIV